MKERFYVLLLVSIELEILGNKILVVLSLFGNLNLAHYFIVFFILVVWILWNIKFVNHRVV